MGSEPTTKDNLLIQEVPEFKELGKSSLSRVSFSTPNYRSFSVIDQGADRCDSIVHGSVVVI